MSHPTRRTRIVCISDTHNSAVKLPKGDVLIHAGDLTNQGSYSEVSSSLDQLLLCKLRHAASAAAFLQLFKFQQGKARCVTDLARQLSKAVQWLEKADFEAKIVIAGIKSNPLSRWTPSHKTDKLTQTQETTTSRWTVTSTRSMDRASTTRAPRMQPNVCRC